MRITYDHEADALYIELRRVGPGEAENRDLAPGVVGDFGPDGRIVGIEVLLASAVVGVESGRVTIELGPAR